jgi:hypothetical protein
MGSYTNVIVEGSEFPVHWARKLISRLIFILQIGVIVILTGGEGIRAHLSFIPREVFAFIDQKKWIVGIGAFFIGNQLSSILSSSGAFEVYCNDSLVCCLICKN